jgi:uncharacterized protein
LPGANAWSLKLFEDKTILITGASSGIGAALARRLARDGAGLILVARRVDRLAALAEQLKNGPGRVHMIAADLIDDGAATRVVVESVRAMGRVDVLVNNAGVGEYGEFKSQDAAALERMIQLNTTAVVRMTHAVLPEMLQRRSGRILNIASTAAFQPTPYMAVYGATKAFVRNFSLALWWELRHTGVQMTCVCPGPVRTEFFDRGGYEERREDFTRLAADADWVAERAYGALAKGRVMCVPGFVNWLGAILPRLGSLKTVTRVSARILGPR